MIKVDNISVMNMENAIRGMRNPLESYDKSDSHYMNCGGTPNYNYYILGENDLDLLKRLCNAGTDHRKVLRQIFVSMDILAPLYWYKEYDTYKVGTTANSTSTMHTVHKEPFTMNDFSLDKTHEADNGWIEDETGYKWTSGLTTMETLIGTLNAYRYQFLKTNDKKYWYSMIQLLPSSYNQLRTCTMSYENLVNMYFARRNHKLDEWREFCTIVEELPYMKEILSSIKAEK